MVQGRQPAAALITRPDGQAALAGRDTHEGGDAHRPPLVAVAGSPLSALSAVSTPERAHAPGAQAIIMEASGDPIKRLGPMIRPAAFPMGGVSPLQSTVHRTPRSPRRKRVCQAPETVMASPKHWLDLDGGSLDMEDEPLTRSPLPMSPLFRLAGGRPSLLKPLGSRKHSVEKPESGELDGDALETSESPNARAARVKWDEARNEVRRMAAQSADSDEGVMRGCEQ